MACVFIQHYLSALQSVLEVTRPDENCSYSHVAQNVYPMGNWKQTIHYKLIIHNWPAADPQPSKSYFSFE